MTREFPDELLSAYLDGELSPSERTLVEQRLAASETDRQLLTELRSLRGDLATLPGVNLDTGFADRVVRAALAAQVADVPPPLEVASASAWRTPKWVYAVAASLAAAASLLIAMQSWRSTMPDAPAVVVSPADQIINTLRIMAPAEGQALVVRLQAPRDAAQSIEAAFAQAGIQSLAAAEDRSAVGALYRRQIGERIVPGSPIASDALLVEAPLAAIERALVALAGGRANGVILFPETKLDWRKMQGIEGENQSQTSSAWRHPYAQRLDAAQFPLSSQTVATASPPTAVPAPSMTGPVRVIILVEQR